MLIIRHFLIDPMKTTTFMIVGKHPVTEAIKNPKRKVIKLFLTEDSKNKINRENQPHNVLKNIKVIFKTKKELDNLCDKRDFTSHQGYIAEIENLEDLSLKDFVKNNNNKNINLIALDEVTDPRNIGSIIRTAASFKIDGLIVKERSYPFKSKLLYKSASGAIEHLKVFRVSNISTIFNLLKKENFWISTFSSKGSKDFTKHNWTGKNILLFGSEGFGIRKNTEKKSDFVFKIDIDEKIESLNVSNSVSIVCHHINYLLKR